MRDNGIELLSGSGICQKCGNIKVQMGDGIARCLDHDVVDNPPSGKVVTVADPGDAEMMKVLKESGVRIEKGDSTNAPKTAGKAAPVATIKKVQSSELPKSDGLSVGVSLEELEAGGFVATVMQKVYDALDEMSFTTMKDAKRVMKVQEKIERFLKGV